MTTDGGDDPRGPAWHERTPTLLAASLGAVVAIGLVYLLVSTVMRQFDDPAPQRQFYPEPSSSQTTTSATPTTTSSETITSTSPPVTTDIDDPNATSTTTSGSSTSGSETSGDSTTTTRTSRSASEDGPSTSRSRPPRFNETRTLYPRP